MAAVQQPMVVGRELADFFECQCPFFCDPADFTVCKDNCIVPFFFGELEEKRLDARGIGFQLRDGFFCGFDDIIAFRNARCQNGTGQIEV